MSFFEHWQPRGHTFGTCMSKPGTDLMYVNIPKNASSWTKPNLLDWGWEFYNYHFDHMYHKHAVVVLRDPVDRWLSGVCEYFALYHEHIDVEQFTPAFYDLVFDQVTLDDHTEKQVYFIEGLDPACMTFFRCDSTYRLYFAQFLRNQGLANNYSNYDYQHTTDGNAIRTKFKNIFEPLLTNSKYLEHVKQHYKKDYELIDRVNFWHG